MLTERVGWMEGGKVRKREGERKLRERGKEGKISIGCLPWVP